MKPLLFFNILSLIGLWMFSAMLGGCIASGTSSLVSSDEQPYPALESSAVPRASGTPLPASLSAEFPLWQLGSFWEYSDGYGMQVVKTDGKVAILKRMDRPKDWVKRHGLFKVDSMEEGVRREVIYQSPNPEGLFPLAVNKGVSFVREYLVDKKLHVHQSSWKVVGLETIEVPAGKFDCWVLVWNTRSQKSNWSGYEKWWYSPEVGNYVRMEYRYGKSPDSSRVLVNYRMGGGLDPEVNNR
ncbi:MAG: hypothetical protein HQL84_08530 [Magnetococcales bacterium]|nr:hypothetical protein [Magnetococcales bacterium]MBF0150076.1 hypothetical protein [Magnetococcales bacterium]